MKSKKLQIDGQIIEAKMFVTRKAADNYMSRKEGRKLLFFKSGQYYVSA